ICPVGFAAESKSSEHTLVLRPREKRPVRGFLCAKSCEHLSRNYAVPVFCNSLSLKRFGMGGDVRKRSRPFTIEECTSCDVRSVMLEISSMEKPSMAYSTKASRSTGLA